MLSSRPVVSALPVIHLKANRPQASEVSTGSVLDYAVEKCIDSEGNVRCTKPFLVEKSKCYDLSWSTEGTISHTTVEVRDAGSDELVYYRDTNGQWHPDKGEVSLSSPAASFLLLAVLDFVLM